MQHSAAVLQIRFPDLELNRQLARSINATLRQRRRFNQFTIFYHGNDHCYPFSTLHQSYPMHLVALANGNADDVAGELEAYASLQSTTGAMDYRIGAKGPVIYFSYYTEAMFILCLYQYVQWTGDWNFLKKVVENNGKYRKSFFWYKRYNGFSGTMLEHAMLAADFTLARLYQGCVPCMDWHDALPASSPAFTYYYQKASFYPPRIEMKAAAEGTFVWCDALEKLAILCARMGKESAAMRYLQAARIMRKKVQAVFFNRQTGLYGELIDGRGRRYCDTITDFWSYPQIRAVSIGLVKGTDLLEKVLRYRSAKFGITTSARPHFTVTANTLNMWPEKNLMLALEFAKQGKPDETLRLIKAILPERLHQHNPKAPKHHWAEAYDPLTAEPRGVTYGGDPELVHACLEGLCGITVENGRVQVLPRLPQTWRGKRVSVTFQALRRTFQINLT